MNHRLFQRKKMKDSHIFFQRETHEKKYLHGGQDFIFGFERRAAGNKVSLSNPIMRREIKKEDSGGGKIKERKEPQRLFMRVASK